MNSSFGLLRTCKQTLYEGLSIYLTKNLFLFDQIDYLEKFLDCIGREGRQTLTRLGLVKQYWSFVKPSNKGEYLSPWRGGHPRTYQELERVHHDFEECSNLRLVDIWKFMYLHSSGKFMVKLFADLQCAEIRR